MNDIFHVTLSEKALRNLKKVPLYIALKLESWIDEVGHRGLNAVRRIPSYHDEPLKGKRRGQRSIRLNIAYRAIYVINEEGEVDFVDIQEVNKHEY